METADSRVTRGHGLLEGFLAGQRARQANALIPEALRSGRILDVGCGSYPAFLVKTSFAERYGVDRVALGDLRPAGVTLVQHDIAGGDPLPFEDGFFDVVTMLAVFEHIEPSSLDGLLRDVRRMLRPGGVFVMTTPVHWTERLLNAMSRVGLVSREEVGEHKAQYSRAEIASILVAAGFDRSDVRQGSFELGMNLWALARKKPG